MVAAIIGGTGIYALEGMTLRRETVSTPYGDVALERTDDLIFINRHAPDHSVPPHRVNYRAHIKALSQLGVRRICATFAVGSINPDFELAVPIILDDFIDFSQGRKHTFFDTLAQAKGHVDMSTPFCPVLSAALEMEAKNQDLKTRTGGVYASTNGPRFESPAEIRHYRAAGADVVGMTLCPELPLAKELGMAYAGFAYSINWGAGMTPSIELHTENIAPIKQTMMGVMIAALANTNDDQCPPTTLL